MSVHYKFKSSLEFDTVTFDGLHISVIDLKKAIMQQKKIGKSADFDLQITNAQTKEVYDDDEALIPKNTSVIVARVPVSNSGKKIWERGEIQLPPQDIDQGNHIHFDKLAKTADLANAVASEEEKIKAMMKQSSQEYDVSKYVKSRSMTGPLPANYTCYRCGKPGHWIKNCPTNNLEIKRSTGIPRSFMVPVDGPEHKGALLTSTGDFAVPLIDHQAYKEVKKERPPFLKEPEPLPNPEPKIPADLLCMLCKDLLQDAVLIPCCGNSFCDECIRTYLLESENQECPECHQTDVSPDTMIPNRFLRNGVMKFKKETGYITVKSFNHPLSTIHTSVHVSASTPISAVDTTSSVSASTFVNSSATSVGIANTTSDSAILTSTASSAVTASTVASTAATDATKTIVTGLPRAETIITTTTTTVTTNVIATISPSTATSSVDCHTAVSSIAESSHMPVSIPIQASISNPAIVITAVSVANSTTASHSPYSTPTPSPVSTCNTSSTIGAVSSLPVATPPSSPRDISKENVIQNGKTEVETQPPCLEIVPKAEDFNSSEEIVGNHNTESATLDIELDDNQPGTPLADEPPVDLEAGIPLESKLPVDALQSSMGSPYESAIPIDTHNDNSLSPTRDSISGSSIATITTRGPAYMLSGFGFGRAQQNSRQYSQRSNASHESSFGSSRATRSSRSGFGTPPRERYRQGRRSDHSNYKSSYGGYGSQSSSHHMSRNYQSGPAGAATSLSSHGSQSRYGTQVQSHRVNIPPGYISQNIQRPHPPLSGLPPNYPVQPPPAKHFERGEETGRGILPLPHRVSNEAAYKRKLNSSPLEMHAQVSIPSQPPPPGVAPVLLATPQTHGGLYPYQHDDFYHESRRMKDRNTVGDPLDDFARQLIEYSREQQRRPSPRHCSRSRSSSASHSYNSLKSSGWSHSGSHSDSHSSSRSRSRSFSSRSRSPSYRRSRSRSRSRSFSRSSHSRSRSVSRSRSRSRGRNSTPRKRSNSKSNSPKNFTRYVPRSPYHQKKDYSTTFFNPSYHPSYTSNMPHPTLSLDHFADRNRYYRDQYKPYDDYHNVYNSPRYEQHDQRYDPKYTQEYQRFDNTTQHRSRTREVEKYERGRSRDVSHRRESVSKSICEKSREIDGKDSTDVHSKPKKKEEKVKHKKHHHKNKEGKKEVKQEEHKKREQQDVLEKGDVAANQNKKSDVSESSKKTVLHDNKDKKHKHKKRKENDETKKKKKSRELARAAEDAGEKSAKSKKKKAKKELGKAKVDIPEIQENVPDDKHARESPHDDTIELAGQSPNVIEAVLRTDDAGLEEDSINANNLSHSLEETANDVNIPFVNKDEQPPEVGENANSPREMLREDSDEIRKEDFEEAEQPLAVEVDEGDDNMNPEMTDDGEKADSDEGAVHSDEANIPEISFELPEISKWEREELEEGEDGSSNSDSGNMQETKASLPSDIIQRAEKAILQKPLKDAIIGPPTSRDKHRSLEKKISEKPLRSGDGSRDSVVVVVNVKETKSKDQGIEKELSTKDKTEEDSLEITISAEKNKRSVQTKSKTVKRDKSVDSSLSKKLKLDRSKFSDQLKSESLVSYADSSDNVTTEKLYSSDTCTEFSGKSESASRKKDNIIITKKEKERKCNIESGSEKTRNEDGNKKAHRSTRRSPSNKAKPISSNPASQKHELSDYNEIKIQSKLELYEHDIDKRAKENNKKHRTEGRAKRKEPSHGIKEEKSLAHREHYRESEQHNLTRHLGKRKSERSRSKSYDSDQNLRKGHRSRSQMKSEDRKRTKKRSPTRHSSAERKQLSQESVPFGSRTDSTQMNYENRTLKESFLVTRNRKESTQDEANFEPNYDETSDSDNISEAEDSKKQSKHHSERRSKKFEPVESAPKLGEFETMRIQESIMRAECSNDRILNKRRDRSNSTVSSSGSSPTGSVSLSSGTEKSSRKRLRSNSSESDVKHRHHKSKHKKHKKHRHKHKRKKCHKYKQR